MASNDDYEVGYGKPPKHAQFKPGKSGNPKGRPRKPRKSASEEQSNEKKKDMGQILNTVLDEMVVITEGGKQVKASKREVILKRLVHDAIQGRDRARQILMPFLKESQEIPEFEVEENGKALLEDYFKQHIMEGDSDA